MAEYLVSVPELKITDTYVDVQRPAFAARKIIDEHDHERLSLRDGLGILVIVQDERSQLHSFRVRGSIKNLAEAVR